MRVVRWKTNDVTLFEYLPSVIVNLISKAIEDSETDNVFTHSGSYPKNFYKILRSAVEAAGLVYGRSAMDGITFHRARHSFITRLVQVTDIATAASFSGHSDGAMVVHYSHASKESRREVMEKLYGAEIDLEKLRQFYDKVVAGNLSFEEFSEAVLGRKF